MSLRCLLGNATAALMGVALFTASFGPASAFTLSGRSVDPTATSQVESVFWRGGGWHGGWRRGGWGWGPGAIVGGLAAGALVGGYYGGYYGPYAYGGYGPGYGNCWRDGWGRLRCY
jgi:hypothetical protein